ncbi:MAG: LD-carboxypeptidase [Clostridiales bacterium]|jgi:muramoyltetrapeptide carboxypeptidase|nr:LD-carboxypeptidase [Clostridiales bacterium]
MVPLRKPAPLKAGDKVALVAPSGPLLHPARLEFAIKYLKSLGLSPVAGESCTARHGYLAGADHLRAADINRAFGDAEIRGIFCIRGGYGAARILDAVDYQSIRGNPKFFCGYSDVTALHTAINQKAGLMTFHTPMLCEAGFCKADAYTLEYFEQFMFQEAINVNFRNPPGRVWQFITGGRAQGPLCGGNLAVIASLMATAYELDTRGKIIFLEDIGEEPYKIDRMLNQLRMAGKFDHAAGIVFGDFADCKPENPANSLSIPEVIGGLRLKIPALYNFACGHCAPTASLPLGAVVTLDSFTNSFKVAQL